MTAFDWNIVEMVGIGLGVFIIGIAALIAALALKSTLERVNKTLDEVDRQLEGVGKPVAETLAHIEGIAGTADDTIARIGVAVGSLEGVAGSVTDTTGLVKDAITPAIVNLGATLTGISAGLRRLFSGRMSQDES